MSSRRGCRLFDRITSAGCWTRRWTSGCPPPAGSSTRDAASKASANRAALLENTEIKELAMASRYGPRAGRTVSVHNNDTTSACRSLDSTLYANSIAQDRRAQRFYMKPGKRAEQKTALRHRKTFMKGFKHLMDIVQDAKRKGY
ncbi:mitochondrial 37S ribosomal protein bS21m KNAG_0C03370 [Huiozyma naganishii CBS 8797]|uniref:Ribosomal protein S21 n=1 Tax=Huiozyma naganishii (strain ATCC MYA-139 / BCRC 22969 / CBS 8797 / KCTC 17520 / NBRC 10181 / NCYC 3082 / Yp74L-3) TaxID=1071383 RepID=J7S4S4_HUIN7|nr:hypothetical protein KNAG_0C03370 [Kazachstania naganishii CBS 8797]CCK69444.1 hypothetical protein KNAG_0C03370 [Kazachstania naganishii CBS 8797]